MAQKLSGTGSWFNHGAGEPGPGPADGSNRGTASGIGFDVPGIAVYNRATLGGFWRVTDSSGRSFVIQQTDIGPSPGTGRAVDFTWLATQKYLGGGDPTGQHFSLEYLGKNASPSAGSSSGGGGSASTGGGGSTGSQAGANVSQLAQALAMIGSGGSTWGGGSSKGSNPLGLLLSLGGGGAAGATAGASAGGAGATGSGGVAPSGSGGGGSGGVASGGGGGSGGSGGVAPGAVTPPAPVDLFGTAKGGPAPGLMSGKSSLQLGRTDMGVDFSGAGPVPAVIHGNVTRVEPVGSGNGWPGGAIVVVQGTGPSAGKNTYLAENFNPAVKVGQQVKPGDVLGHAIGSYPFIEYGWAADPHGTTLAHATTGYTEGQVTPAGSSFLQYLKSGVPPSAPGGPAPKLLSGGGIAGVGSRGVTSPLIPIPGSAQTPGNVPTKGSFPEAVLTALGAPITQANSQSLATWFAREGTKAQFNPMATTQSAPGATQFNSVGVKNYPSFQTGVKATAATLNNGLYPGIVSALKSGQGLGGSQLAGEFLKWSGNGYSSLGLPQFPKSATVPQAPPQQNPAPKITLPQTGAAPNTGVVQAPDLSSLFAGGKGPTATTTPIAATAPTPSMTPANPGAGGGVTPANPAGSAGPRDLLGTNTAPREVQAEIERLGSSGGLWGPQPKPVDYVKAVVALRQLGGPSVKPVAKTPAGTVTVHAPSGGGGGSSSSSGGGGGGVLGGVSRGTSSGGSAPSGGGGGNVGGAVSKGVGGLGGLF